MIIYYLDEPLNHEEFECIKDFLVEREGDNSITSTKQIRIPFVFPTLNSSIESENDLKHLIDLSKNNLIKAGILKNYGKQVVLIMPKDIFWGGIMQLAIFDLTGFHPYILQRWFDDEEGLVRRDLPRIIDGHGMMGYKD